MPLPCSAVHVVVVDDDTSFRSGLAANLEDDGHVVGQYEDPAAVPTAALQGAEVVVTDYQMAAIDGLAFADRVHAVKPRTPIVLVTAYWTVEIEAAVAAREYVELCRKPVDYDELHTLVHRVVGGR